MAPWHPFKGEFAATKQEVAKELRAELKAFVQEEVVQKSGPGDGNREVPKVSGATSSRLGEGCDADMIYAGSQPASPRFLSRLARSRQARSANAPLPSQQDIAEHLSLTKLPELANDTVANNWMDGILAGVGPTSPARAVFLPSRDFIAVRFDSAAATDGASAMRALKIQYSTRAGIQMEGGL